MAGETVVQRGGNPVRVQKTTIPANHVEKEPDISCGTPNADITQLSAQSIAPYTAITNQLSQGIGDAQESLYGTPTKIFRALERIEQPEQMELLRLGYCRSQKQNLDLALDSALPDRSSRLRAQMLIDGHRTAADAHGLHRELGLTGVSGMARNDDEIRYIYEHTPNMKDLEKSFSAFPEYGSLRDRTLALGGWKAERNIALLDGDIVKATMISLNNDDPETIKNWVRERVSPQQLADLHIRYRAENGRNIPQCILDRFDVNEAVPLIALLDGKPEYAFQLEQTLNAKRADEPATPLGTQVAGIAEGLGALGNLIPDAGALTNRVAGR